MAGAGDFGRIIMGYSHGHKWTPDDIEKVRKLATSGHTIRQVADIMGLRYNQVATKLQDEGIRIIPKVDGHQDVGTPDIDVLHRLKDQEISKALCARGYKVERIVPDETGRKTKIDPKYFDGKKIQFAVISCTHFGSKFQQITHLHSFYQYAQSKGIEIVFHAGDMTDGIDVYTGHEFELFIHGIDAQRDYVIDNYPKMENGGKTYVIAGNHDFSFKKKAGSNIVKDIASQRDDIEYLGVYGAYPQIPGLNIYLQHGAGGQAYAVSYKMQKNIEKMSPESKPDLYLLGHYHTSCLLLEYRNVTGFMLPSFQAQTPYARRHGWPAENGGFIITVTVNDRERKNGVSKTEFEFVPFYVPIDRDY